MLRDENIRTFAWLSTLTYYIILYYSKLVKLRSLNLDERWALRRSSSFSEGQQPMMDMTSATWFETELSGMGVQCVMSVLNYFFKKWHGCCKSPQHMRSAQEQS